MLLKYSLLSVRRVIGLLMPDRFSIAMKYTSAKDVTFLESVSKILSTQGEALVLFRYARAGGNKDFMFFNDMPTLLAKLETLPANTNVIVYGESQLPLRGQVDSEFISRAVKFIPEGSEYLILCLEKTIHDYRPHHYWESFEHYAGETIAELSEDLNGYSGRVVAVGLWPPWPDESDSSIEAYIPDDSGKISPGPY